MFTQKYARSPVTIAGVHPHRAEAALLCAVAMDRRYKGEYAGAEATRIRGSAHVAEAHKHNGKEVVHRHLEAVFAGRWGGR